MTSIAGIVNRTSGTVLLDESFKQAAVGFERGERAVGAPQYTFRKSFRLAMDGVFSFSTVPLRLATWLGLAVSACAFAGAVFTFCEKVFAEEFTKLGFPPGPHGIPTLVISILFLGGVQLICLGILGEYVARIYDEVKGRPLWVVRDSAGIAPQAEKPGATDAMQRS